MGSVRINNHFRDWAHAAALAALLNLGLFSLMPGLVRPVPKEWADPLAPARVVRVKQAELPPKKNVVEESVKPKPARNQAPKPHAPKVMPARPRLALLPPDLNVPALPQADLHINAPLADALDIVIPTLKSAYAVGELDGSLIPLAAIQPSYPFRAKQRGIEGSVTVEFLVTAQGRVEEITILESEPLEIFDRAVENALALWQFQPPTKEGVKVAARVRTTIRFQLEEE